MAAFRNDTSSGPCRNTALLYSTRPFQYVKAIIRLFPLRNSGHPLFTKRSSAVLQIDSMIDRFLHILLSKSSTD